MAITPAAINEVNMRIADCKSFTKIINVPATASGVISAGYVSGSGVLVTLTDALGTQLVTPNHIEITFMATSVSQYATNINLSGYAFNGYGWVHPWGSNMQTSSTFRGLHPDSTLAVGAAAYGKVAMLGKTIEWNFGANNNVSQIQIFNRFGQAVTVFINYSFEKIYTTETGSCGY